jgi:L-lysine 2,3-aminomutase
LSNVLINIGVLPYYLHQLDRVAGTAHFEVSAETARSLVAELRDRLPGYAIPRLVQEIPGRGSKTSLETL